MRKHRRDGLPSDDSEILKESKPREMKDPFLVLSRVNKYEAELSQNIRQLNKDIIQSDPAIKDEKNIKLFERAKQFLSLSVIGRLVSVVILLMAAIDKYPYGFYQMLRWVVCAATGYTAYLASENDNYKDNKWCFILTAIAIIFNPISPFQFRREDWQLIDFGASLIIFVSIMFTREDKYS